MTPNLNLFLDACIDLGLDPSAWIYAEDRGHRLTWPAASGKLGPIVVHDDGDGFIVDVGIIHHTHIRGFQYPATTDVFRAAIDAARFVLAVMSDGVCVTVDYLDGRCIGSSHFFLDSENLTPDTIGNSPVGNLALIELKRRHLTFPIAREQRSDPTGVVASE